MPGSTSKKGLCQPLADVREVGTLPGRDAFKPPCQMVSVELLLSYQVSKSLANAELVDWREGCRIVLLIPHGFGNPVNPARRRNGDQISLGSDGVECAEGSLQLL